MFIQLPARTGGEGRKTDYRSTLVKCQHDAARVAKRRTSHGGESANRQLALSESTKNKQTFGVYK